MKPSRVGRRALRGGRHAVRAVGRRPIPVSVVGLAAATVLGLGAIASADPAVMGNHDGHRPPFGSHQFGPRSDPQFGMHMEQLGNWPPGGAHHP
jgi:hypothetical protein